MKRTLTELLEIIGQEIHESYADDKGVLQPITRDEALAREVWRRALGHKEETTNADGTMNNRVYPPDPKMQQFIFERREGKNITPVEERSISLLEKMSAAAKSTINKDAEQIVKDDNSSG